MTLIRPLGIKPLRIETGNTAHLPHLLSTTMIPIAVLILLTWASMSLHFRISTVLLLGTRDSGIMPSDPMIHVDADMRTPDLMGNFNLVLILISLGLQETSLFTLCNDIGLAVGPNHPVALHRRPWVKHQPLSSGQPHFNAF